MAARSARAAADETNHRVCGPEHGSGRPSTDRTFCAAVGELGWIEGSSIVVDYRPSEGVVERAGEIAAEFVRLKVNVIVTGGDAQALAAKRATAVIPIVFGGAGDPVGNDLVASLARPRGNVTGSSVQLTDTAGKRLEIFRELIPGLHRLAISGNFSNPTVAPELEAVLAAADALGLDIIRSEFRRAEDRSMQSRRRSARR
jgi:putative ABC transport system substrate-binding protein